MNRKKLSLNENDLSALKREYNLDLTEPNSLKLFEEATRETSMRIREKQLDIFNSMYPHRKKRIPSGPECSFCLRKENEVTAMAKHESGFNLCYGCVKRIRKRTSLFE